MKNEKRTWELWGYRFEDGELWHVGERDWVELQVRRTPELLQNHIVPVLVEEMLGDPYAPEVTHYGWQYRHTNILTTIQIRAGSDPSNPKSALMLLDLCFPGKIDDAIEQGAGSLIALRITKHPGAAP